MHYSHWGADLDLRRRIAADAPHGGPLDPDGEDPVVDPDPLDVDVPFVAAVAEHLDFLHHEALFVVSPAFSVTEFRVLPFVVPTADGVIEGSDATGRGALVEVRPLDPGAGYVRGWFDGIRDVVGELVDRGALTAADVVPTLLDRLHRFAGLDRELIVDPARRE